MKNDRRYESLFGAPRYQPAEALERINASAGWYHSAGTTLTWPRLIHTTATAAIAPSAMIGNSDSG